MYPKLNVNTIDKMTVEVAVKNGIDFVLVNAGYFTSQNNFDKANTFFKGAIKNFPDNKLAQVYHEKFLKLYSHKLKKAI